MEICVSCIWCGEIYFIEFIRPEQYSTFLCIRCQPEKVECESLEVGGKESLQQG